MRILLITLCSLIVMASTTSFAQSPPVEFITVQGKTDTKFNKVSLFQNGDATEPLKTEAVSEYDGEYSINIEMPQDMVKKGDYYSTDMRFWNDKNENGVKDDGEPVSECHFIIWVPAVNKMFLQVYQGERYPIEGSVFYYNYKNQ